MGFGTQGLSPSSFLVLTASLCSQVYQNPLMEMCMSTPLMNEEQVWRLFGPVEKLMDHHELFFAALSQRTKDWAPEKGIGDLFVSSV